MRIGIVSDVHSNLTALEAVLQDMGAVDAVWCLGDFVGYGPYPNECIALLRDRGGAAIAGNHDLAAIGTISTRDFNKDAAAATKWTTKNLTSEAHQYLASLQPISEAGGVTLAHGSPRDPIWEYVLDSRVAWANLSELPTELCLVGHTHIPSVFVDAEDGLVMSYMPDGTVHTLDGSRTIANPGSVGQPRDHDPRAAYLVYDTDAATLEWRRVAYDIAATQKQMRKVHLPRPFIERLDYGA